MLDPAHSHAELTIKVEEMEAAYNSENSRRLFQLIQINSTSKAPGQ